MATTTDEKKENQTVVKKKKTAAKKITAIQYANNNKLTDYQYYIKKKYKNEVKTAKDWETCLKQDGLIK